MLTTTTRVDHDNKAGGITFVHRRANRYELVRFTPLTGRGVAETRMTSRTPTSPSTTHESEHRWLNRWGDQLSTCTAASHATASARSNILILATFAILLIDEVLSDEGALVVFEKAAKPSCSTLTQRPHAHGVSERTARA
ncbi:hypothetical protein [Glaciihabitans tibetensis]|uniref:hypothetical protein n=1 Tax=Glaciihabitans tibetensis TaxID=1266600 RepID=UPI000D0542EE|nr:hypothetical protein [Glaciihabitans tibetensis]